MMTTSRSKRLRSQGTSPTAGPPDARRRHWGSGEARISPASSRSAIGTIRGWVHSQRAFFLSNTSSAMTGGLAQPCVWRGIPPRPKFQATRATVARPSMDAAGAERRTWIEIGELLRTAPLPEPSPEIPPMTTFDHSATSPTAVPAPPSSTSPGEQPQSFATDRPPARGASKVDQRSSTWRSRSWSTSTQRPRACRRFHEDCAQLALAASPSRVIARSRGSHQRRYPCQEPCPGSLALQGAAGASRAMRPASARRRRQLQCAEPRSGTDAPPRASRRASRTRRRHR